MNREAISLTAISDRFKIFLQKIQPSYPGISIRVKESISIDHTLSPANALHLFSMMEEAVNNALRHSNCKNITIQIESDSHWTVSIIDDGIGMINTSQKDGTGNGLINMKHRAVEAGWCIEWLHVTPQGTKIKINQSMLQD